MVILSFVFITVVLGIYLHYKIVKSNTGKQAMEEFILTEMDANTSRRKDVEAVYYYAPDLSGLPFREYNRENLSEDREAKELGALQEKMRQAAAKKMLNFGRKRDNLELKRAYGATNLDVISSHEENYQKYILTLLQWAEGLIHYDHLQEAETVLRETIKLGSDYSKSYTLLGDIYFQKRDRNGLARLSGDIMDNNLYKGEDITKARIINYLKDLEEQL